MSRNLGVTLRIEASGREAVAELARVEAASRRAGRTMEASGEQAERGFTKARRGVESISKQLSTLQNAGAALATVAGVAGIATTITRIADSYTGLNSQLRLVTGSEQALAAARQDLFEVSQRTRQSMDATVNLYARMTRATQSLGLSEQQRLSIVETVNQAMVISGTSSAAASGALTQLGQALASGTLRGDEFNSIAEQAPVIMDMLSASLGKTRGELRAMAEQGQLTSEVLVGALLSGAEATQKQFDQMQLTIAGASQQLANAFNELVGGSLDSSGATSAVAASISLLAMNLGTVIPILGTVAAGWGTGYIAALAKAKIADVAKAASTATLARAEALAAVERAKIQARDLAATQQVIVAARAQELAKLAAAQAEIRASQATIAATTAIGAQSAAIRANALATDQLTAAKARAAAATTALATLGAQQARVATAQTAATAGLATAQAGVVASSTAAGAAMARLGGGLLALVGGPIGLAVIGIGAVGMAIANALDEAEARRQAIAQVFTDAEAAAQGAAAAIREVQDASNPTIEQYTALVGKIAEQRQSVVALTGAISELRREQQLLRQSDIGNQAGLLGNLLGNSDEIAELEQTIADYERQVRIAERATRDIAAALGENLPAGARAAMADIDALVSSLANASFGNFVDRLGALASGLSGAIAGAEVVAAATARIEALRKEAEEAGKTRAQIFDLAAARELEALQKKGATAGVLDSVRARQAEERALIAQIEATRKTATSSRAASVADRQAADATRRRTMALDNLTDMHRRYVASLSPMNAAEAQRDEQLARINEIERDLLETGQMTVQRMREIEAMRAKARADYDDEIGQLGQRQRAAEDLLAEMDREIRLMGLSEEARREAEAVMRAEAAMRQAINAATKDGRQWLDGETEALLRRAAASARVIEAEAAADRQRREREQAMGVFGAGQESADGRWFPLDTFTALLTQATREGMSGGLPVFFDRLSAGLKKAITENPLQVGADALDFAANFMQNRRAGRDAAGSWLSAQTDAAASSGSPEARAVAQALRSIDAIFSGRLMGTSWQRDRTGMQLAIGGTGISGSTSETQVRQRSFFRGRQWSTTTTPLDSGAQSQLEDFLDGLRDAIVNGARALRAEVPPLIEGSFAEIRDATGRVISQTSTILGRQWSESVESFQRRLSGENIIALIDRALGTTVQAAARQAGQQIAAGIGGGGIGRDSDMPTLPKSLIGEASAIAERWRADAETLLGGAQFLLAAATDIRRGSALLTDGSLTDLADLIEDLAQPGEALVDAYQRAAGATRLLDEALSASGIVLDRTRADVVRFAAGIAEAAGGLEQATELWQRYFEVAFTPAERGAAALDQAIRARDQVLGQAGLGTDTTIAQLRGEIERLLAAGGDPARIALLLRAADAIGRVNERIAEIGELSREATEALEAEAAARREALGAYAEMANELLREAAALDASDLVRELGEVRRAERERIATLNDAARAAGMQAAREEDLARAHLIAAEAAARAIERARAAAQSIATDLYGTPLSAIEAQIAALEAGANAGVAAAAGGANDVADAWQGAIGRIRGWLDDLMTGTLGGLRPRDALAEARRQFELTLGRARGGDAAAAAQLPQLAETVLRLGQRVFASGDPFTRLRDEIRAGLQSVVGIAAPGGGGPGGTTGSVGGAAAVDRERLEALIAQRDEIMRAEQAAQRRAQAEDLAAYVREIAGVTGDAALTILAGLGVPLGRFAADLGVNLDELNVATTNAIAGVANRLGIELPELARALDVSLGELSDRNALINDALETVIARQSPELAARLEPLLRAIEDADSPEARAAAIAAFEREVAGLPAAIRLAFAPFFDAIDPESTEEQIAVLSGLRDVTVDQLAALVTVQELIASMTGIAEAELIDVQVEQRRTTSAIERAGDEQAGATREVRDAVSGGLADVVRAIREASQPVEPVVPGVPLGVNPGLALVPLTGAGASIRAGDNGVVRELQALRRERAAADGETRRVVDRLVALEAATKDNTRAIERATTEQRRGF